MPNLPAYILILFALTTALTFLFLYRASGNSKKLMIIILFWLVWQSIVAYSGFYLVTTTIPPRFLILVLPPLLLIFSFFVSKKGRAVIDGFDKTRLVYLHSIRVPVEIVLWLLFINKLMPEVMTFEGRNLDILSGTTAPFVAYFGYAKNKLNKFWLLSWNFICVIFLFNIVTIAILSAPFPFQQLGFEQPNTGVLYFPFIWLPCFIVPAVLFSHLVCIRALILNKK